MPRRRPVFAPLVVVPPTTPSDWLAASWSAQEAECRRLSAALHDDVGTLLSATRLRFSQLTRGFLADSDEADTARNVSALLEEAIHNVRRLTQRLLPATLESLGLAAALNDYVGLLSQTEDQTVISLRTEGLFPRLPYELELTAFRVVQELVRNALQHASARSIEVYVLQQKERLLLTVSDDGVGFRASAPGVGKGLGLKNIESRLNVVGGRLIFDLTPGQGVCVLADIPLVERPTPTC
jgi:signal transduction histidine kinase